MNVFGDARSPMDRNSVLGASIAAFVGLIAWWAGIVYLDGVLAATLPYDQYETVALLYPDVFYPALPGWILAHAQPFPVGFWVVSLGWMIVLTVGIGAGATIYATRYDRSPTNTAVVAVVISFVAVTVIEAATTVLT